MIKIVDRKNRVFKKRLISEFSLGLYFPCAWGLTPDRSGATTDGSDTACVQDIIRMPLEPHS